MSATAPVCSPSRSCLVTGVYATTLGTQHLRSHHEIPPSIVPFPKNMREAGYYVSNNVKEDYNFTDTTIWHESSKQAHWRKREGDEPFFSVFNLTLTHQSSIFGNDSIYQDRIQEFLPFIEPTRPESLELLPYYPDTEEVRKLWARYYTNVSIIDYQFGQIMAQLEEDGLQDNTIVFFFSDHGTGMPRAKRAVYDSGLRVPLLIHVPDRYLDQFNLQMGKKDDRIVSFVDFAPTVLSIADISQPDQMQGASFLENSYDKLYAFGASDRVDEGYDLSRSLRSRKYRYIRNFMPHLPLLQPNFYTDQSRIMEALRNAKENLTLNKDQLTLFQPARPVEELYDISADPHELNNLVKTPEHQEVLIKMRKALGQKMIDTYDTGLIPEPDMISLSQNRTPYDLATGGEIPFAKIMQVNDLMLSDNTFIDQLVAGLKHENQLVRYWALIVLKNQTIEDPAIDEVLQSLLSDVSPTVQLEAASLLVSRGHEEEALRTIFRHMDSDDYIALYAARTFQFVAPQLDTIPEEVFTIFEKLQQKTDSGQDWSQYYVIYTYWSISETLTALNIEM